MSENHVVVASTNFDAFIGWNNEQNVDEQDYINYSIKIALDYTNN